MKPEHSLNKIATTGVLATAAFGISAKDQAHVLRILRDKLYSDKVLAVLREYATNAWDAHQMAGKPDLPIKVVLPTTLGPTLVIRDYGPGISETDIYGVFTQYGASTKRDDNVAVGMLGIGCKAGFAYSDRFTVTSWNGGMKKVYAAALDETDVGVMLKVHESPCGEETGLEIQVPVRAEDIDEFKDRADLLLPWFEPRPECNLDFPASRPRVDSIRRDVTRGVWTVVMGCVPYTVDLTRADLDARTASVAQRVGGTLIFDIGEITTSANREQVELSGRTLLAIKTRMEGFIERVEQELMAQLATLQHPFARWQHLVQWTRETGLNPPADAWFTGRKFAAEPAITLCDGYEPRLFKWVDSYTKVDLTPEEIAAQVIPKTLRFARWQGEYRNRQWVHRPAPCVQITLRTDLAVVVSDVTPRELNRYDDHGMWERDRCLLVLPNKGADMKDVMAELAVLLDRVGIGGIPIHTVTELRGPVPAPARRSGGGGYDSKYRKTDFLLVDDPVKIHKAASVAWRTIQDSDDDYEEGIDLLVRIDRFEPVGGSVEDLLTLRRTLGKINIDVRIFGSKTRGASWSELTPVVRALLTDTDVAQVQLSRFAEGYVEKAVTRFASAPWCPPLLRALVERERAASQVPAAYARLREMLFSREFSTLTLNTSELLYKIVVGIAPLLRHVPRYDLDGSAVDHYLSWRAAGLTAEDLNWPFAPIVPVPPLRNTTYRRELCLADFDGVVNDETRPAIHHVLGITEPPEEVTDAVPSVSNSNEE